MYPRTYSLSVVKVTGGTIDGTPIGGTTPAAGAFTTGVFSGDLSVATSKFTVDATSGDTAVAGAFSAGGIASLPGGCVVGGGGSMASGNWLESGITGGTTGYIQAFDRTLTAYLALRLEGLSIGLGTVSGAPVTCGGTLAITGNVGFYGQAATAKPTGVAVSAAGIHAALVTLNLIAA